jgi:predicted AlkP superfamily pyrophosphatase or phosphodiesterase
MPAFIAVLMLLGAVSPAPAPAPPVRHVVLISIDGLMPGSYTRPDALGLAVPNLRRLAAGGTYASGVVGVLPSITYPSHTTLITGVPPSVHGIVSNTFLDPEGKSNDAWRWYARNIRVPTLVHATRAAGRRVGAVSWPVSVGLDADHLFPEFWRWGSMDSLHATDLELVRALATPGLFEAVETARGAPLVAPLTDAQRVDVALTVLRTWRPELLLLHLLDVDHEQHEYGPGSPEARAAIERSDAHLGRILETIAGLGLAQHTLVAVVSDHGFQTAERAIRINTLLVDAGLIQLDEKGAIPSWKAYFQSHGGSAALYLADPQDDATRRTVRELLKRKMAEPGSGLREVIDGDRLAALGGDPAAELFVDAADGFTISRTPTNPWFVPPVDRGYHGFAPDRPALHASLILSAPQLRKRGDLGIVPLTSVANTLAAYLGIELSSLAAPALPVF